MKRTRKVVFLLLIITLIFAGSSAVNCAAVSDWAQSYVEMAEELNLVPTTIKWNYQASITRQEFCALIVQVYETITGTELDDADLQHSELDYTAEFPFADTQDQWVRKAYSKGIVLGISKDKFGPELTITRQEIMLMIYRTIQLLEDDLKRDILVRESEHRRIYQDEDQLAAWAKEAVILAVSNELVRGVSSDRIGPLGRTTVEEAITLVARVAAIVDASSEKYFLEQGNYVKNGEWWAYDIPSHSMILNEEWANVKEAYSGLVLKKDGTLYLKEEENSTWKVFGLDQILHIEPFYSTFYVIRMDGSVWECDRTDWSYRLIEMPEDIESVKGGDNVIYALGKSGSVYYWDNLSEINRIEGISEVVEITRYEDTFRAMDHAGIIWEWKVSYDGNGPVIGSPEKTTLGREYFDYFGNVKWEEELQVELSKELSEGLDQEEMDHLRFDDTSYLGLFIHSGDGKLFAYQHSDFTYQEIPLDVKDVHGNTYLDRQGSVWNYERTGRAGGFQWLHEPSLIPGMKNVVIIDEDVALKADGSIWSWGYTYPEQIFEEHKIGQLPETEDAHDFLRLVHHKGYIYLLDQSQQVWKLEDEETQKIKARKGLQTPVLFIEDVQQIGYGFVLGINGQLLQFDELGLQELILEQVKAFVSDENQMLAISEQGKLFYMANTMKEVQPYELNQVSKMKKIWMVSPGYPYIAVGETDDARLVAIRVTPKYDDLGRFLSYEDAEQELNIKDYEEFFDASFDLIVKKKSGNSMAWFTYENLFLTEEAVLNFGPETGLQILVD